MHFGVSSAFQLVRFRAASNALWTRGGILAFSTPTGPGPGTGGGVLRLLRPPSRLLSCGRLRSSGYKSWSKPDSRRKREARDGQEEDADTGGRVADMAWEDVVVGPRVTLADISLTAFMRYVGSSQRRCGRVSHSDLDIAERLMKAGREYNSRTVYQVIRAFGMRAVDEAPETRTERLIRFWKAFDDRGKVGVGHYAALLEVFLENDHNFSPAEVRAEVKARGWPLSHRGIYRCIIGHYCRRGDLVRATKVLATMKLERKSVGYEVFHELIGGHCVAGDVEAARSLIDVMLESGGLRPTGETYMTLVLGMCKAGRPLEDIEDLLRRTRESKVLRLDGFDISRIVVELTRAKRFEAARVILNNHHPQRESGFQMIRNVVPQVLYLREFQFALELYDVIATDPAHGKSDFGLFFLRPLVLMEAPLDTVVATIRKFRDSLYNVNAPTLAIQVCIQQQKLDYARRLWKRLERDLGQGSVEREALYAFVKLALHRTQDVDEAVDIVARLPTAGLPITGDHLTEIVMPRLVYLILLSKSRGERDSVLPILRKLRRLAREGGECTEGSLKWSDIVSSAIRRLLNRKTETELYLALDVGSRAQCKLGPAKWHAFLARAYLATRDMDALVAFMYLTGPICRKQDMYGSRVLLSIHNSAPSHVAAAEHPDLILKDILVALKKKRVGVQPEDCDALLARVKDRSTRQLIEDARAVYAETDVHWTPAAMESMTAEIRDMLRSRVNIGAGEEGVEAAEEDSEESDGVSPAEMEERLLTPGGFSSDAIAALLQAYREDGDLDRAAGVLRDIFERGLEPPQSRKLAKVSKRNSQVINTLVKAGRTEEAGDLVRLAASMGYAVFATDVRDVSLQMLNRRGPGIGVFRAFLDQLPRESFCADRRQHCMAKVAHEAAASDSVPPEEAEDLILAMMKSGHLDSADVASLSAVVKAKIRSGSLRAAMDFASNALSDHNVLPGKKALMEAALRAGDSDLFEELCDLSEARFGSATTKFDKLELFVRLDMRAQARKQLLDVRCDSSRMISLADRLIAAGELDAVLNLVIWTRNMRGFRRTDQEEILLKVSNKFGCDDRIRRIREDERI